LLEIDFYDNGFIYFVEEERNKREKEERDVDK